MRVRPPVALWPPWAGLETSIASTRYPVTGEPFGAAGRNRTIADPLPGVATTPVGTVVSPEVLTRGTVEAEDRLFPNRFRDVAVNVYVSPSTAEKKSAGSPSVRTTMSGRWP